MAEMLYYNLSNILHSKIKFTSKDLHITKKVHIRLQTAMFCTFFITTDSPSSQTTKSTKLCKKLLMIDD